MARSKGKTGTVVALSGVLVVMFGLVAYAPTLYQMFCAITGYGGTVNRLDAPAADTASSESVTVRFDANVGGDLDWDFAPEQRSVETHFGEPTQVYYTATNNADHPVVARAVYNVTPYTAAQYFFKIECFCFTEERLGPGETARMPLVLYIDEQMLKDEDTRTVEEVTLSYTFYEQDVSEEDMAKARDLKQGSKDLEAELDAQETATFDNDAPRR